MNLLKEFTEFVKINLDRLILALFIFLAISGGFFGGCKQRQVSKLTEKITKLNIDNDQLQSENKEKRLMIGVLENQKSILRSQITNLEVKNTQLQTREDSLQTVLDVIYKKIENIPPDSSYRFIQAVYPFKNENKPYKFNSQQVKAIHRDILENSALVEMNKVLRGQVLNCEARVVVLGGVNEKVEDQLKICSEMNNNFEQIIDNQKEEIKIKDKQLKRIKNKTKFWKMTTAIAAGAVVLLAL